MSDVSSVKSRRLAVFWVAVEPESALDPVCIPVYVVGGVATAVRGKTK